MTLLSLVIHRDVWQYVKQKLIFGEELQGSPDWWISEIK